MLKFELDLPEDPRRRIAALVFLQRSSGALFETLISHTGLERSRQDRLLYSPGPGLESGYRIPGLVLAHAADTYEIELDRERFCLQTIQGVDKLGADRSLHRAFDPYYRRNTPTAIPYDALSLLPPSVLEIPERTLPEADDVVAERFGARLDGEHHMVTTFHAYVGELNLAAEALGINRLAPAALIEEAASFPAM